MWLFWSSPRRLLDKGNFRPDPCSLCSQHAKSRPQQFVASQDAALQVIPTPCQPMINSAPEMHAWAPLCPLLLKTVLAPAKSDPSPDVSLACRRAVLRAGFPIAPFPVHLPVLRKNYSRSDHPPPTPVQCTAAVTSIIKFLVEAKLAADVLATGSTFSESPSEQMAIFPSLPFVPSFPNLNGNRGVLAKGIDGQYSSR